MCYSRRQADNANVPGLGRQFDFKSISAGVKIAGDELAFGVQGSTKSGQHCRHHLTAALFRIVAAHCENGFDELRATLVSLVLRLNRIERKGAGN